MVLENKRQREEKVRGSRLSVLVLLLGTIFLSLFFWLKNQFGDWWSDFSRPYVFQIVGEKIKKGDSGDFVGLEKSIKFVLKDLQGEYGLYFYDLKEKESFGINEDRVFTAASINKIPVMVSFYQQVENGKFKEEDEYVLKKEDIQDYGTGSMRYEEPGKKYKYQDLITLIGKHSDNTANYVMINLLGTRIQEGLDRRGMKKTSMEENKTTPQEMGNYFVGLYRNELVKDKSKEKILKVLTETEFEDRIPKGVLGNVQVAHKTGNEVNVYNDCGIIFSSDPYVLCILSEEVKETEALEVMPKISKIFWELME